MATAHRLVGQVFNLAACQDRLKTCPTSGPARAGSLPERAKGVPEGKSEKPAEGGRGPGDIKSRQRLPARGDDSTRPSPSRFLEAASATNPDASTPAPARRPRNP